MGAMGCYPGGSQVEVVKMKPRIQVFRERPTKTYPTDEIRGYVSSKGRISTSNTCEPLKMPTPRHKALIGDY